jgi:hypothetical protein
MNQQSTQIQISKENRNEMKFLRVQDVMDIFGVSFRTAVRYRISVSNSLGKSTYNLTIEDMKAYYKL